MIKTPSILITDDDPYFRETVCGVFEPEGFRTLVASCGEEAYEIVCHEEVHVVLLDMHMPRLTGLQTMRMVKEFKPRLPCILMSGRMDDVIREEAKRESAFQVLSKPVSRLDLTDSVHQALEATYGWG